MVVWTQRVIEDLSWDREQYSGEHSHLFCLSVFAHSLFI